MDSAYQQSREISVGEWMITILIAAIPLVGFIMLFVWGFGGNVHPVKANWAKATLAWIAIAFTFYTLLILMFGSIFLFSS
jgi:hypothetical protein